MRRAGVQAPAFCHGGDVLYQSYVGRRFGRWTVIDEERRGRAYFCLCRCDCGTIRWVRKGSLKDGTSRSCGCGKTKNNEELYIDAVSLRQLGNTNPYKSNKLGVRGVNLKKGKFRAQICMHGKQSELGCFNTLEEAISARRAAEEKYKNEVLTEEKMAASEAQKRATRKYEKKTYDRLTVRLPKGTTEKVRARGESVNKLINQLLAGWLDEESIEGRSMKEIYYALFINADGSDEGMLTPNQLVGIFKREQLLSILRRELMIGHIHGEIPNDIDNDCPPDAFMQTILSDLDTDNVWVRMVAPNFEDFDSDNGTFINLEGMGDSEREELISRLVEQGADEEELRAMIAMAVSDASDDGEGKDDTPAEGEPLTPLATGYIAAAEHLLRMAGIDHYEYHRSDEE